MEGGEEKVTQDMRVASVLLADRVREALEFRRTSPESYAALEKAIEETDIDDQYLEAWR